MVERNVILTGLQRSGTTLACHLLNKLPDTVALHEPMKVARLFAMSSGAERVEEIRRFFGSTRRSILAGGTAVSKNVDGLVPDNHMSPAAVEDGLRKDLATLGTITIGKSLDSDFMLVLKHPAAFTALVKDLARNFPCYAVVRNPLAVIASWNSIDMPAGRGRVPAAERIDGKLKRELGRLGDPGDRQVHIADWFFRQYLEYLPAGSIIFYEDIVSSGGRALKEINGLAGRLDEKLVSKNRNPVYRQDLIRRMGEKLLKADGAFWQFYSRQSVEELLA